MLKSVRIAVLWCCMASQICERIFRLLTVLKAVLEDIFKKVVKNGKKNEILYLTLPFCETKMLLFICFYIMTDETKHSVKKGVF